MNGRSFMLLVAAVTTSGIALVLSAALAPRLVTIAVAIASCAVFAVAGWQAWMREQAAEELIEQVRLTPRLDPHTGLPTRTELLAQLDDHFVGDVHGSLLLIVINIDSFAQLNDSLGSRTADRLLRSIAQRLRGMVPQSDMVARLDSDEFAVVSPGGYLGMPDEALAERLMTCFADEFALDGQTLALTASIGWANAAGAETPEKLLRSARWAVREAKRAGKNRVRSVDHTFEKGTRELVELEADLREAIAAGSIGVAFQPIVAADGSIYAYEALARWERDGQPVAPDKFFAVAERIGLSSRLGEHILHLSCLTLAKWQDEFGLDDVAIAVNFSGDEIVADEFVARVADALTTADLAPGNLIVEISDAVTGVRFDKVVSTLQSLRRLGVQVALDDFGAGFQALNNLDELPVNMIKIDRGFVNSALANDRSRMLFDYLLGVAKLSCDLTVAEGVESEEQRQFVIESGVDLVQGYHLAAPKSAGDMEPLMKPLPAEPLTPERLASEFVGWDHGVTEPDEAPTDYAANGQMDQPSP